MQQSKAAAPPGFHLRGGKTIMAYPYTEENDVGELVAFPGTVPPPDRRQPPTDDVRASDESPRVEPYVYDAELVDEDQAPKRGLRDRLSVLRPRDTSPVRVIQGDREPLGRVAGRAVARSAMQVALGHAVWASRAVDAATHGAIRERIRQARAAGDLEAQAAWMDRLEHAKTSRRQRIRDLPRTLKNMLLAVLVAVVVLAGLLLIGGIAVAFNHPWGMTWSDYWSGWDSAGHTLVMVVAVAMQVVAYGWLPAWLFAAHRAGRARGALPVWAISPAKRDDPTAIVTPAGIVEALAHLGIAPLNKAFKDGWTVAFEVPPVRVNNRGYHCVFSLPMGVTPDMIADKRAILARNLHRDVIEVWPAGAERAGFVDLWVANAGSANKPAPEYPLLHKGVGDVFAGVPLGISQRGDMISPPLVEANVVFGGLMGQGKSNAARVMMLGAALDPLAELWVYVFAGNGDFDAYRPRLGRYERGVSDEVAAAGLASLEELYAEVGRREERLADINAKKVTRGVAEKYPDLRPIVALYSECHELFSHEEFGKAAADFAVNTLRRARKTAIILAFDTQSSRADAIPPKIVELVKLNACFAVKTWRNNDGFLGDGSFQAGIRATELRPGKDRGNSVLTGATSERFEILKWCYVQVDDDTGWDAATDVIERSMEKVHPAVTVGAKARPVVVTERDLLEDLDAVLGAEDVPAADVPALLSRLAPDWQPYRVLTGKALVAQLAEVGVKVPATGNRWPVRPETVRAALAQQATTDLDEDAE